MKERMDNTNPYLEINSIGLILLKMTILPCFPETDALARLRFR